MANKPLEPLEAWFVTGSQHLYGEDVLQQVADHSRQIAATLDEAASIPVRVVFKPVVTTPDAIRTLCLDANAAANCVGLIAWMHTFSPAKMWIGGLNVLQKPLAHLHTQFNREIPWSAIDMDFMNLNQSAHGDREFGFMVSRLRINRKVVVGHWQDQEVQTRLNWWSRAASAWHEAQTLKLARFGENMRQVGVTEGDKVDAERQLGVAVNAYGVGDLVAVVNGVSDAEVDRLVMDYDAQYAMASELQPAGARRPSLRDAARIELGLRSFLSMGGFRAFTDTFEDLHGLKQLPGIGAQRMMADGYGFGAEGDWKTSTLVRLMKVMATGLPGGTSFMEDYTYHLTPGGSKVLGAHMLEVCPTIAAEQPSCEIHPLAIGGKEDPVRLVFTAPPGSAVVAGLLDFGDRFRLVVNAVDVVAPDAPLPRLPVARALWQPRPDLATSAEAWILAGAPHHTSFSQALPVEPLQDFAEMAGIECVVIDQDTR
ncbi:MAG TPA: L-arabinose isomerase, partial [Chloroflexota bacterium]|nr:L-arabinose isomerase [Chloroflexota bacterium]